MRKKLRINLDVLKDMEIGIDAIAFTNDPAIELKGLAFAKKSLKFIEVTKRELFVDNEKMIVAAPIMIPKDIYRYDDVEGEYDIIFDKETIEALHHQLMSKLPKLNKELFNDEHEEDKIVSAYMYQIILVSQDTDKEYIKQKYKQDVPLGSSFIVVQVRDKKTFEYLKKNGKTGFSIEGMFKLDSVIKEMLKNKIEMSKSKFKKVSHIFKKRNKFTDMIEDVTVDGDIVIGAEVEVIDETGEVIEDWSGEVSILDESTGEIVDVVVQNDEIVEVEDAGAETETETETTEELESEEEKGIEEEEKNEKMADDVAGVDVGAIIEEGINKIIDLISSLESKINEMTAPAVVEEMADESKEKDEAFKRSLSKLIKKK